MEARILFSPLSPFAAKARMAAALVGYPFTSERVNAFEPSDGFLERNPLGKLPILVTADGSNIHDSRVILRYLDQWSGGRLYPGDESARLSSALLESLADGISDCMQNIMMEVRFRPDDKRHAPYTDWYWSKVQRSLKAIEEDLPTGDAPVEAGQLALRAMLGYLVIRFEGQWEADRPRLQEWAFDFDRANPRIADYAPRVPSRGRSTQ